MTTFSNVPERDQIVLYRGDDFSLLFQALDEAGDPIDLSDKTILVQLRKLHNGGLVRSFTPYIEDLDEAWFAAVLWAPDTAAIPCGETISHAESRYVCDARIRWPEGSEQRVRTLRSFDVLVQADVSRPVSP